MPDRGPALADDLGRPQALVGVGGRHPDVDDRDVGAGALHQLQQLVAVAGQPDDLEPGLREQAGQPLAQDHRVVGQRLRAWDLRAQRRAATRRAGRP